MRLQVFLSAAAAVLPLFVFGETVLQVSAERPSGIYRLGEEIVFRIVLADDGKPVGKTQLNVSVRGDAAVAGNSMVMTGDDGRATVKVTPKQPTVIHCRVSGPGKREAMGGAVVSPEKIMPAQPEPEDFDSFWDREKKEISALPERARMTPVPTRDPKVAVFSTELNMAEGEEPAYGYLALPANSKEKSLPVQLIVHGAGRYQFSPVENADRITFSLNPYPLPNGKDGEFYRNAARTTLAGYALRNGDDHEKIYFRGMYRRLLRTLKFLKSRPEWDGRTLIVSGSSQGGAQTLAAAGLDPQVSCITAYVPALCDLGAVTAGRESGWPKYTSGAKCRNPETRAVILRETAYVDSVNFARRIKNPVCLLSTGLIDPECPSSSVFAAYNVIPAQRKQIVCTAGGGHKVSAEARQKGNALIAEHLKQNAAEMPKTTRK